MSENKDMRELSLDEMDKVSGGAGECFNARNIRTDEELNFMFMIFSEPLKSNVVRML